MHPLVVLRLLALMLLGSGLPSLPVHAGQDPAPQAAAPARYTSRSADTLEKIAARQYPGSPLQPQVLARQLQQANAGALVGQISTRQRLKAGIVLSIPSHELMLRQAVTPHLPAEALQPQQPSGPEARKHWVHYP